MSRTGRPGRSPGNESAGADALDEWSKALASSRAGARRRVTARRHRRQALPAIVTGSLTLAGLGLSMSWVNTRIPVPPTESPRRARPPSDAAAMSALDRQLSADDRALAALSRRAAAARSAANTPPPETGQPVATAQGTRPAGAAWSSGAITVPTLAPLPPLPSAPAAPPTDATTGASHAH